AEGVPGAIEWPTVLLPPGTGDGDILVFRIDPDPENGERRRREVRSVQSELSGDGISPQDR
nr:hypothetical protein [bacterium]